MLYTCHASRCVQVLERKVRSKMSEAYLPVAVPSRSRKTWTSSDQLRWLRWLVEFYRLDLARLTTNQRYGLCENIVRFYSSYPFGLRIEGAIIERRSIS